MCKDKLVQIAVQLSYESENPNLMQNLVKSYFSLSRQINFMSI